MSKIRTDFVTNSSSSSYIIAYKSLPSIDNETILKYPFLKNYDKLIEKILLTASDSGGTIVGDVCSTIEEYEKYFIDQYSWCKYNTIEKILRMEKDYYLARQYNKCIDALKNGFKILIKRVDYDDSYCSTILNGLTQDEENFIMIESD